ncbi:hypothetical protein Taro_036191 [Colocasia esculenta]|uniref:Uncharacterized protein n=1 Tax=Colocasia esculenta TaxID=4460 RepID=A0A843WCN3_COLES|nr:hypothetical protein [Colocasia esculenta]
MGQALPPLASSASPSTRSRAPPPLASSAPPSTRSQAPHPRPHLLHAVGYPRFLGEPVTCVVLGACSGMRARGWGTDTSRRHWSPASPVFPVSHFWELGPESLKVPGLDLQLCGLQVWCWLVSTVLWFMVVELQLDLSSVTARLRGGSCVVRVGYWCHEPVVRSRVVASFFPTRALPLVVACVCELLVEV